MTLQNSIESIVTTSPVIVAMAAAEQVAQAQPLATRIPRIASHTIYARGSTTPVAVLGT